MAITINMFGQKKGINKGAFQGEMRCPFCSVHADPTTTKIGFETEKTKVKYVGNIGPLMREYKCMTCGGVWRYDINARELHPYSSFTRGLKDPRLNLGNYRFRTHKVT